MKYGWSEGEGSSSERQLKALGQKDSVSGVQG